MDILSFFTNAASGGLLGSGLQLLTSWVDTKNKIALMKAQTESAEKVEAWKAFTAAQSSNTSFEVPTNTPAWASAIYTCVAALKDVTRPLLTFAAVVLIYSAWSAATGESKDALGKELVFGGFTAIFFWFGSRYTRK
jgi:hypothetical protein